jgi:hypothetical protein
MCALITARQEKETKGYSENVKKWVIKKKWGERNITEDHEEL